MAAVWLMVRAGARARWRSWLLLAVLAGLIGGLVITVAAGARRTDAAYPALVTWSGSPDEILSPVPGMAQTYANVAVATAERLPQVTGAAELTTYTTLQPAAITVMAPASSAIPGAFWHRKLLAGRVPAAGAPDQADISFTVAQSLHLGVGATLRVVLLGAGEPVPFVFHVAGIDAAPGEFPPQYGAGIDLVWATPAFARQAGRRLLGSPTVALRLRRGAADVPGLERELARAAGGKVVSDYPLGTQAANTQRSIHLQAVALWLLAGLLALLGLLLFGQLLSRLTALESVTFGILRAAGMSPAQLTAVGLVRAAAIGTAGAVLAVVLAIAASPLFPVGLAAIAEPRPGIDADWPALGLGLLGVVVVTVCCAAWPARRAATASARPAVSPARGPAGLAGLVRSVRPVPAATGIRLALRRGAGPTAVPVASTITACVVGVIGLSAALVFTASLGYLLNTPRLYGVQWDALVSDLQFGTSLEPATHSIAADPQIAQWTGAYEPVPLQVNGVGVGAVTTGPGPNGSLAAVPLQGSAPRRPGDIVLGQRTLAALGARIGDTVRVSIVGVPRAVPLRVVGSAVFPALGDTTQLGTGAELTVGGLLGLAHGLQLPPVNALVVRFQPGISPQQGINTLAARVDRLGPFAVTAPSTPADLVNFGQLQDLPLLIGLSLGVLAVLTIAHLLLTSVRRRRRDLAILRALGFTGRQVRATVSWMAVTVAAAALAVGVPVGLLCGREIWRFLAAQLGIEPVVMLPLLSLLALIAAGLVLAIAIAAIPGAAAARTRPAEFLRAE